MTLPRRATSATPPAICFFSTASFRSAGMRSSFSGEKPCDLASSRGNSSPLEMAATNRSVNNTVSIRWCSFIDHSPRATHRGASSTRRRECPLITIRSVALARFRRHREAFLEPRLPPRGLAGDGSGRLIAVKVEAQGNHALATHVEGAKGGYARPRLVEPQQCVVRTLGDVLRHAAKRRDTRG